MDAGLLGPLALWGAIVAGAVSLLPGVGPDRGRRMLTVSALLAAGATLILAVALIGLDFSLAYVAETTSRATPWPYRLAALWGGMDGSLLFYAAMTLAVGRLALRTENGRVTTKVVALTGVSLLVLTATLANPFEVLAIPAVDGGGLLAILQHPAMVYHPPILYLGLTTLVVPFAFTSAAALEGRLDLAWMTKTRRWLFVSWTALTLGMLAGANWAYVELGWGGFWAWDPVENTALMPWLAATAFLHTSRVSERDGRLRRWSVVLALLPFAFGVLGVYLTRSGVTGSIHSFAENAVVGRILLGAALLVAAGAAVVAMRSPKGEPWERLGPTRDTWLASNGVLLAGALVFVTVGSAYPAYVGLFLGESVAIDTRFFTTTIYPIALLIATGIGFALQTTWARSGVSAARVGAFAVVALVAFLITVASAEESPLAPVLLLSLAAAAALMLIGEMVRRRPARRALVGFLAHLGIALVMLGGAGSALGAERTSAMSPGDRMEVGGHSVLLETIETGEAGRFIYVRAGLLVDGAHRLEPEIRAYEQQALPITEPTLRSTPLEDVIVAISRVSEDGSLVNVSVFVRPMVWWVWLGALTIGAAGLLALLSRGEAVSVQRRPAREELPAAGTTSGSSVR